MITTFSLIYIYIFFLLYYTDKLKTAATAEVLRNNDCISSDINLLLDEIYLQKCEEYFGGELFATDETGNLHKCMTTFMIIDLTKNVPYVIHAFPENNIEACWLMDDLIKFMNSLHLK